MDLRLKGILTFRLFNSFSDYESNKLYWVDGLLNKLEMSNLDGTSRVKLLESLAHPFSVVVYGGDIYWTEWGSLSVKKINKLTPQSVETVTSQVSNKPTAILVSKFVNE